jgi:hypothetical protein
MTGIIEAIDTWTASRYHAYNKKLYGFCELIRTTSGDKGEEHVYPITVATPRVKAGINDNYTFITWVRWINPVTYENNSEWSFGKKDARFGNIPLRIVLAHKTSLGEDLVFDFINAFPNKFTVPGMQLVFSDEKPSIDPDHESIVREELGPAAYISYEKHRLTWNVYVLNVTMQFLECEELTP